MVTLVSARAGLIAAGLLSLFSFDGFSYRGVNKGLYALLSRTQAGPGRTVKQEQKKISRNHVQTFIYLSVRTFAIQEDMLPCALRPLVLGMCATLSLVEFVGLVLAAACFTTCLAPQ